MALSRELRRRGKREADTLSGSRTVFISLALVLHRLGCTTRCRSFPATKTELLINRSPLCIIHQLNWRGLFYRERAPSLWDPCENLCLENQRKINKMLAWFEIYILLQYKQYIHIRNINIYVYILNLRFIRIIIIFCSHQSACVKTKRIPLAWNPIFYMYKTMVGKFGVCICISFEVDRRSLQQS